MFSKQLPFVIDFTDACIRHCADTDWEWENMAAAAEEGIALLNPLDI